MSGTCDLVAPAKERDTKRGDSLILAGVTGGHAISHFLYQGFLVMLPAVRDALSIGPIQIGAIMTAREIASGLASLPGGIICDRLWRYWGLVLALCMAGFGLGWLVVGLSSTYSVLIVGMVVLSISASIWHLPAMAALSQRFSHRRGAALAIHGAGGNVGDVLGPLMTGVLLGYLSWRGVLSAYAIIPLLLAFVVIWVLRGSQGGQDADPTVPDIVAQLKETRRLLRNVTLWRVNLVSGLRGMCYQVYTAFLPLHLADELGFDSKGVGFHLALLFSVGIVASPVMGYLSDRLGRKAVLVPTLMGSCILSLMLALFGEGIALTIILALLGLFLRSDYSLLSATALDIVGHNVATTTLGVLSFTRFIISAISPLIAGVLYERLGMDAALYYAAGLFALAALLFLTTRLEQNGE